jgi:predicted GH43/DUF377 family glycosyl hydrolase
MNDFKLQRLGIIMEPEPGNPLEAEGVLNPAAVRGPDGGLYLFPRLVAKGNYSRIGIARVKFNADGDPVGVHRLGIALEPEADYEKRPDGSGGCEDARVTFVEPLQDYIMSYTAFSPDGPRIALARSKDLLRWERLGLATYEPYEEVEFNGISNKDACMFPAEVHTAHGHRALAMLHRPLFPGTRPEELRNKIDHEIQDHKECIWMSYCHLTDEQHANHQLPRFVSNYPIAIPEQDWEKLKVGAGTPPALTKLGWVFFYHGVHENQEKKMVYSAGVMILAAGNPRKVIYRSKEPVLAPELPEETVGTVANVVFPTGVDCRHDLGKPHIVDVYYGMADNRIGVARLVLPNELL